jgi:hypothetical protein
MIQRGWRHRIRRAMPPARIPLSCTNDPWGFSASPPIPRVFARCENPSVPLYQRPEGLTLPRMVGRPTAWGRSWQSSKQGFHHKGTKNTEDALVCFARYVNGHARRKRRKSLVLRVLRAFVVNSLLDLLATERAPQMSHYQNASGAGFAHLQAEDRPRCEAAPVGQSLVTYRLTLDTSC